MKCNVLIKATLIFAIALLSGCATPPTDTTALKKVRFIDTPEGARAILDDSILFNLGETTFATEANSVFDALKPAFDRARGRVIVEGHTDTKGSDVYNKKLSQERADKVRTALIQRKISPSRLIAKGYGKGRLARNPERSEADASMNRRAEFLFEGETVASIGGTEIERDTESVLGKFASQTLEAGKQMFNKLGDKLK